MFAMFNLRKDESLPQSQTTSHPDRRRTLQCVETGTGGSWQLISTQTTRQAPESSSCQEHFKTVNLDVRTMVSPTL